MRTLLQTICLGAVITAPSLFAQFSSPVRETDRPEKRAFSYDFTCSSATNCNPLAPGITIPSGSRMVIEYVSGRAVTNAIAPASNLVINCPIGSSTTSQAVPASSTVTSGGGIALYGQTVKIYCDGVPSLDIRDAGVLQGATFAISGYFATK